MSTQLMQAMETFKIGTRETALPLSPLDSKGATMTYLTLGLLDELSEVFDAIYNYNGSDRESNLQSEISDLLWYMFRLFDELQIDFTKMSVSDPLNVNIEMSIHAGRVAGRMKKMIRDGYDLLEDNKHRAVVEESLLKLLSLTFSICTRRGFSLEAIMIANYEKLKSRKERGVLKGDGGNR